MHTKIWTPLGLSKGAFLCIHMRKKSIALKVFHQTNSVSETIQILGYPTRRQLYS